MPASRERLLVGPPLRVGLDGGAGLAGHHHDGAVEPVGRAPSRTWSGWLESSTVSSTPYVAQMTSGASDEPPMPQSTTWSTPASASSLRSAATSPTSGRDAAGQADPGQPLRGLLLGVRAPQRRRPARTSLLAKPSVDQRRDVRADRVGGRAGGDDLERLAHCCAVPRLLELALDGLDELVPRLHELVDALGLEHLDHVVVVDADLGQVVHHLPGLGVLAW